MTEATINATRPAAVADMPEWHALNNDQRRAIIEAVKDDLDIDGDVARPWAGDVARRTYQTILVALWPLRDDNAKGEDQ